jgi:hypothetical protein
MRTKIQESIVPHVEGVPCVSPVMKFQANVQHFVTWHVAPESREIRIETPVEADPRSWDQTEESLGLAQINPGRLLEENWQFRTAGCHGISQVVAGRSRNNNRIHAVGLEQLMDGLVGGNFRHDLLATVQIDVRNTGQGDP